MINLQPMLSRIYKSHLRSLIRLSIPIISGQIGWVLMGFADNIMVSKVGYVSLAAAGITNSVFFLVTIFSMGVLMVVPTIVAEKMHPGSKHTLRSLQQETQWLSQILGIITFGILMLVYFNFDLLDQETAVENEAKPYFLVVAISSFPNLWFMASKNLCDGYQKTSAPISYLIGSLYLDMAFSPWVCLEQDMLL
jgi:MATE family multidrug resistance protein